MAVDRSLSSSRRLRGTLDAETLRLALSRLVVFSLLLLQVTGQAPTITVPPVDQDLLRGDLLNLTCVAEGNGSISIMWKRDGVLLSNGAVMENSVVFPEAMPTHAGTYECVASNGDGDTSAEAMVTVSYAPVFQSLGAEPGEEVVNGSTVTLTCVMSGFPTPSTSWFHNGVTVMASERVMVLAEGVLVIAGVRLSDSGIYSCNSSNSLGTTEADSVIMLRVYYPPMNIMVQGSPPELEPMLGERAELTCQASSMPDPTYSWWREGGGGVEGERVEDTTHIKTFGGNGTLLFAEVQREDAGTYFCTASNGYGSLSSQYLTLRVSAVPLAPTGVSLSSLSAFSADIHWNHISSSYPPVHNYHVEYRLDLVGQLWEDVRVPSNPSSLQLTGLLPYASYLVRVSATNPAGRGQPSDILRIMTETGVPQQPNTVMEPFLSHPSPHSVFLNWTVNFIILATSYSSVRIEVTSEDSGSVLEEVTGRQAEVTGLLPNTRYTISLSVKFEGGGFGPPVLLKTTTPEDAPQAPTFTESSAINSTALRLSWQLEGRIPGVLTGYNVTYRRTDSRAVLEFVELGPKNESVVLDGLGVWSEYEACVSAATEGGGAGNSSCLFLRTLSAAPELQIVIMSLVPLCPPSLRVVWEPVEPSLLDGPEEGSKFVIEWKEEGGGVKGTEEVVYTSTTTEGLVPGLELNTAYNVSVSLANRNGSGPPSVAMVARTPLPGAPAVSDLEVVPGQRSLLVSWQPPPPTLSIPSLNFSLTLSPAHRENIPPSPDSSLNITDLTPGTSYQVTVTAYSGCGPGNPVTKATATLEAPPGPPVITIVTVSSSSVAVQLKEPLMPNGRITGFMVVCGVRKPVNVTESYYVCSGLEADTALSVRAWAVNRAGLGEVETISTSTACESEGPKLETSGGMVELVISDGCSSEADVLVVVQEVGEEPRPLGSYSVEELVELTMEYSRGLRRKRQTDKADVYIAANISRESKSPFQLGDGMKYGDYVNHPLHPDTKYRVGVVGVSGGADEPPVIMTSKDFTTPVGSTEPSQTEGAGFSVELAAAAVGGGLIFLLLLTLTIVIAVGTLICCRRRRRGRFPVDMQGKGSTHSFERSASVRLSGRRGNRPADPVEEYRANYHTEGLEAHSPVPSEGFVNKLLVMKTNDNQLFLEEFGSIEMNPQQPCSVAELPVNRVKNRYHNILPYDHSRVKLSHGKGQGDYINASYCSGFMKVQGFIATQGPLPDTVPDFWRLIWEHNARTIVMLTNAQEKLKTKCEVYWPREVGCSVAYGGIEVTLTDFTQLADYTIRSITINKAGSGKEGREVKQFHFTSWPDHGVPQFATAMLAMVRKVMAFHLSESGPMVVHCSAGVGRTGTFIVIYSMIERMKARRNTIDIYGHVSLLRTQRNYMVQTEDQYFFIYEAVAEAIVCGDTEVALDQLEEYVSDILTVPIDHSEHTHIELQFKRLAVDKSDTYRFSSANKDVNKAKNRYVNVLPYENRRVVLQYQRAQEGSDYINASFVDGYHYRNAFIATQGPLLNTLADFWRMVWEHNVPVIVMLTKCHEKGTERSAQYWPGDVAQSLSCGLYSVEMTVERKSEHYTYRDLLLVDTQTGRKRQVRHFHYLSWPEVGVPSSSVVLMDFLREIQKNFATLNTKSPITVHCSNGIGRTGIFIALHILLERMVTEGLVDVFQTIKNLRIQRPAMVQTLEQYQFCYTAALDYLETSDLANQLHSSTRSDSHSLRAVSNASELRSSRRSLNRNDSLRSSTKRSSRNLEVAHVSNGVSTTVYGDSEATSTFSSAQHNLGVVNRASLEVPAQRTDGGEGATPLPGSPSPTPHLAHLSQSSGQEPLSVLQSSTLPSRGGGSNLAQATGPTSASQSSLGHSGGGVYPVSSFKGRDSGGQRSSQDSLERQIAALTQNLNNSNNNNTSHVVDVYIEP